MTGLLARLFAIVLLAVGTVLVLRETLQTMRDPLPASVARVADAASTSLLPSLDVTGFEPQPLDAYPNLMSRQILFRDRKFVGATPRPAVAPPPDPGSGQQSIVVLGIWKEGGDNRALLQSGAGPAQWVEVGGKIAGATVVAIGSGSVTIRQNGREITIGLYPPTR